MTYSTKWMLYIHPRHATSYNIREHIFCLIPTSNDRKIYDQKHRQVLYQRYIRATQALYQLPIKTSGENRAIRNFCGGYYRVYGRHKLLMSRPDIRYGTFKRFRVINHSPSGAARPRASWKLASFPGHFLRGRKNGLVYTVRACANYSVKSP